MKFLKNQPFPVEAFFESSIVLTFAVSKGQLQKLIPNPLELDTFQDTWGFQALAMVQTRGLRPKGFPKFLGSDFFLIGYRIFVRYTNQAGRRLRGLYIIKSETDKRKMEFFGNIFTHYNYTTTDIHQLADGNQRTIQSVNSKFKVIIGQTEGEVTIPDGSPFSTWKDARKFAGPLPHTFTCNPEKKAVLIIEGVRQNWKPEPVQVKEYEFKFLNDLKLQNIQLASAFEITDIPYYWKKGRLEQWS